MQKHFVTFLSPGTFVAEDTTKPIDSWDVSLAQEMAHEIRQRYNATPYAFYFTTRQRNDDELDSREINRSGNYFLGGKIETLAEVEARATEKESILLSNMRGNGYDRIITNNNSWRTTQPFSEDDVWLDWTPKVKAQVAG